MHGPTNMKRDQQILDDSNNRYELRLAITICIHMVTKSTLMITIKTIPIMNMIVDINMTIQVIRIINIILKRFAQSAGLGIFTIQPIVVVSQ